MKTLLLAMSLTLLFFGLTNAQGDADLAFGDLQHERLHWGVQPVNLMVYNNSDYLKYLVVQQDLRYEGTYLNPSTSVHFNFVIMPQDSAEISFDLVIPANFGRLKSELVVYDVVDTLDEILPSQQVFNQPIKLYFPVPDRLFDYVQERLAVPARVGGSKEFDHEFARLLLVLLNDGMSVDSIRRVCRTRKGFVESEITHLQASNYISEAEGTQPRATFPVVRIPEAQAVKPLVDRTVAGLVDAVTAQLAGYDAFLDSMVAAGTLSADKFDLFDGGVVLYNRFAAVGPLLLWYGLGTDFINGGNLMHFYRDGDPCNARMGDYMYVVEGGDIYNGSHFYMLQDFPEANKLMILFGDVDPSMGCVENFWELEKIYMFSDYWYEEDQAPVPYSLDTATVNQGIAYLARGSEEILDDAASELTKIAADFGRESASKGYRHWFWNQVATRTLEKLKQNDLVPDRRTGQFRIETVDLSH